MNKLVIFGAAEIAELAYFYFTKDSNYEVSAYVIDDKFVKEDSLNNIPILAYSEFLQKYSSNSTSVHVGLSYTKLNQLREEKYNQIKGEGYSCASYISTKLVNWAEQKHIGDNCLILENQTIQPNVKIGNNVMLWSGNHIGHGTIINDHSYISSHVVISGHCEIGKRCFFGVNATVKDFTKIGDDCFISMGASVTKDLDNGTVVSGPKSNFLDKEDRAAKMIKKKYFNL
jgi:sugar O-acyltransferase (sialic acid O-acetyltransferase NeuD family)